MRTQVILIGLLVAACSAAPKRVEPSPPPVAVSLPHHLLDRLCLDDCLGSNGGKEFCEDRCSY